MPSTTTSWFGVGLDPPAQSPHEVLTRLVHVLPTFTALAKLEMDKCSESSAIMQVDTRAKRGFYHDLYAKLFTLEGAVKDLRYDSDSMAASYKALLAVLDELEKTFLSWKNETETIRRHLKLERQKDDRHLKLKSLQTILPDEESELASQALGSLSKIIRFYHKKSKDRDTEISALDQAVTLLVSMQPRGQLELVCPVLFSEYPVKHIREFSRKLIAVLQKRWKCTCRSPCHESRVLKLNLTRYQRFETEPLRGQTVQRDKALFRVMFPTGIDALRWQEADISVKDKQPKAEYEEISDFCRIIEHTSDKTLAKLAIFNQQLLQLQSRYGGKDLDKIADGEFQSLEKLLQPSLHTGDSIMSKIGMRERAALSFILATSFFHAFNIKGSWLSITSADVCFRWSPRHPNIVQPYLSVTMAKSGGEQCVRALQAIHWYPNLLTLGIMLFEIHQGRKVVIEPGKDRCAEVLSIYDEWEVRSNGPSGMIPPGCFQAMRACIDPEQLHKGRLTEKSVTDADVRLYIFERIIYPLGDVISSIYGLSLHQLHDDLSEGSKTVTIQQADYDKQRADQQWRQWKRHLEPAQAVLLHPRFRYLDPKLATVKVAVLDTGLQLPEIIQYNYLQSGYVAADKCRSFCSEKYDKTPWHHDEDGHGTHICQIIHDVAPNAEIYVAKICKEQKDFGNRTWATEVQQNVAHAIRHASKNWGVDMIVMSFGFDHSVDVINTAMTEALKLDKAPLFFAATRNDGAHKPMAWPASDPRVFGISSTDGYGAPSTFNPDAKDLEAILYAFGEGVKVYASVGKQEKSKGSEEEVQTDQRPLKMYVSGTSFATPTAAGLAAILLGFVRIAMLACSEEDRIKYAKVPSHLQRFDGMLKVLRRRITGEHLSGGIASLLPWHFLQSAEVPKNGILSKVYDTLRDA